MSETRKPVNSNRKTFRLELLKTARFEGAPADEWNPAADRYDAVLAYYGAWLEEECARRGHDFVDVHGPLSGATFRGRRDDPDFTLIGDGVHPLPQGHELIARNWLQEVSARGGGTA